MINNKSSYLTDMNKCNSETKQISIQILNQLEIQGESLIYTNKNVNKTNELLDTSNKLLDNMTWIGWFISLIPFNDLIYNFFTKKNNVPFENNESYNNENTNQIQEKENTLIKTQNTNNITNTGSTKDCEELQYLENELNELLWIGTKIGAHLDLHNNYLNDINEKTNTLSNKTLKINKKTRRFL